MGRLKETVLCVGSIGKNADGSISRVSYTPAYYEAVQKTKKLMEEAGLTAYIDSVGNVHGILNGKNAQVKTIAIGSHLDTVKEGGLFDGCAGVMAGIECANLLKDQNIRLDHTLEIIGFVGEEAHPLLGGLLGSSAMMGISNEMDPSSLRLGLKQVGLTEQDVARAAVETDKYQCYLELHVEQGNRLICAQKKIGIVQGIVGIYRYCIRATGQSNHAGTTSMSSRKDALVGMAKLLTEINRMARGRGDGFVATVGKLEIFPNSINIIPGRCEAVLEVRSMAVADVEEFINDVKMVIDSIPDANITVDRISSKDSVFCDRAITTIIKRICQSHQIPCMEMVSGAGHDAKAIAKCMPIAMIFVPSEGGISHNRLEYTDWDDLELGTKVLFETLLVLDKRREYFEHASIDYKS